MHNIWTRAVSTRCSCRCPSCLRSPTAIARRAVGSVPTKSFRSLASSTFWLSATFATVVVADGNVKASRNRQWDKALATARKELDADGLETARHTAWREVDGEELLEEQEGGTVYTKETGELERPKLRPLDNVGEFLEEDKIFEAPMESYGVGVGSEELRTSMSGLELLIEASESQNTRVGPIRGSKRQRQRQPDEYFQIDELKDMDTSIVGGYRPPWPRNYGPELNIKHLPPQSLWSSDAYRRVNNARQWSNKKLLTMDISIAKLVLEFQKQIACDRDITLDSDILPKSLHTYARMNGKKLDELTSFLDAQRLEVTELPAITRDHPKHQEIVYPTYRHDADGHHHNITLALNRALFELISAYQRKGLSRDEFLMKISHNLLISSAPPNLQTYNVLMVFFARIREQQLVDVVWESFHQTHMRPNEITYATLLTHFTAGNDIRRFTEFVSRMRGLKTGLMLAQPGIKITQAGQKRLLRQANRPEKVNQKAYATPMVFESLMHGVLKFAGFDRALEIRNEMAQDGWALDISGLNLFLRHCAQKRQWERGCLIWKEMGQLVESGMAEQLSLKEYGEYLWLCQRCRRMDCFEIGIREGVEKGFSFMGLRNSVLRAATR